MSSAQSENLPNLEIVLLILRLRKFSDCTEHIYSSIRERVEKMERERKGKREGSEGGRERKGREWKMEEGGEEEQGCQGEGGREREEGGRRRGGQEGGSKATCDQCVLQFDSRSHDTGTSYSNMIGQQQVHLLLIKVL